MKPDYKFIINQTIGYQTRACWERETVSDRVERLSRSALVKELEEAGATEAQAREIAPWRIKELRDAAWAQYRLKD